MSKYKQVDHQCLRCGGTERYVANNNCVACAKAATKKYYKANKNKANARVLAWQRANPHKRSVINRRHKYGIELDRFEEMLELQHHQCAICMCPISSRKDSKKTHGCVDHNHQTGEVRALLCSNCNHGLGMFKDNPAHLQQAAKYLELFRHGDQ